MAKHTLLSWREKWVALTGRFRDNSDFEIAEDDYRELSADIGDTFFLPIDDLLTRIGKLENPAPEPVVGVRWITAPKVTLTGANGTDVTVTACEGEFDGVGKPYLAGVVHQAPKPQDGTTRVDILASTSTGWYYIYGEEDGVTPPFVHATDLTIKLLFAAYLVWTSAGATVEEPVASYVRYENGNLIAPDGSTIKVGAQTLPYEPFATTGAVSVDYTKSPNWKGPANSTASITVAKKADGKSTIPDGGDLRITLEGCAGQTVNIGGSGNVDFFTDEPLPSITLPASGNCLILVNNVAGVLHWSYSSGEIAPGGLVDTVNNVTPDAGTKNITLLSSHIDNTVNDATWWGTASLKIKGAFDYIANKVKLLEGRVNTLEQSGGGTSYTDEQAQDAAAAMIMSGTHSGISFTYDDDNNRLNASIATAVEPTIDTLTPDVSSFVYLNMNNSRDAKIANNAVPVNITIQSIEGNKTRMLLIVGNGSATPVVSGATAETQVYTGYNNAAGAINKLYVSTGPNAAGDTIAYYFWK